MTKKRRIALAAASTAAAASALALSATAAHATDLRQNATHRLDVDFCNAYVQNINVAPQQLGNLSVWTVGVRQDPPSNSGGCQNTYARARVGCFNPDGSQILVSNWLNAGPGEIAEAVDVAPRGFCQVDSQVTYFGQPYNLGGFWQTRIYGDGEVRYFKNNQPI